MARQVVVLLALLLPIDMVAGQGEEVFNQGGCQGSNIQLLSESDLLSNSYPDPERASDCEAACRAEGAAGCCRINYDWTPARCHFYINAAIDETSTNLDHWSMLITSLTGLEGCTNPVACNYNELANTCANNYDCGCEYDCYGCTDDSACNWSSDATIQPDGACIYTLDLNDSGCTSLSISSTVTAAFDAPSGVSEGDTVTFSAEFDPSNWTQIDDEEDFDTYEVSIGAKNGWWEAANPVEYTISYSGGYSETGQITKIKVVDGGASTYVDAYSYVNDGAWGSMYWSSEDSGIHFYDGSNELYEVKITSDWGMSCSDIGTVINALESATIMLTMNWSNQGSWTTYHYDYTTPQDQASVSGSDCAVPDCLAGDANDDESVNVSDIVMVVSAILNTGGSTDGVECGDMTNDGTVNVSDVVAIVNVILGG